MHRFASNPSPRETPRLASDVLRAIHLQGARPSESEEIAGQKTAPAGACGEQPPKAALGERRSAGSNLRISTT